MLTPDAPSRWAWAEVDLDAVAHNVRHLRSVVAPSAVWAVVKADGYGHGAVGVALAALDAGADGLCVALVSEGAELRRAGIDAPILLLSQQPDESTPDIVRHRLLPTVYTVGGVRALAAAAGESGESRESGATVDVHVKVDTGMQRVGAAPGDVGAIVGAVVEAPALRLAGVFTHLATADDPTDPAADRQLDRFDTVLDRLPASRLGGAPVAIHAANSAGALAWPRARRTFVRAGIAVYGISPGPGVADRCTELRPALTLRARVSFVKRVVAGSAVSYGLRHTFERDTTVATVPLGYADGVPRRLWDVGGEVLVGGRRRPIVGVVTMDQLMVDVGDDDIRVGDDVVLIGTQGGERIRAEEWAERLGTIGYEVVCGISNRVERVVGRSIGG